MPKKTIVPPIPHIDPPSAETLEKMKNTDYSQNSKVQKAIKEFEESDRKRRMSLKRQWWKTNWIDITTLIVAILTLITTVVFGILGLIY